MKAIAIIVIISAIALAAFGEDTKVKREVQVQYGKESIQVDSKFKIVKDETKLEFKLEAPAKSPMRFRTKYYSKSTDTESKVDLRVTFKSIVEFTETSATFDGYQPAVDTLVRTMAFDNSNWNDIPAPVITTAADGNRTWKFVVSYPHPTLTGINLVVMNVYFSEAPFTVNSTTYEPNQLKIDIGLNNWTFASTENYLALEFKVQSQAKRKFRHGTVDGECTAEDGTDYALFAWQRNAVADGKLGQIVYDGQEEVADPEPDTETGETGNRFFFSFKAKAPKTVLWDPTVETSAASSSIVSLLLIALFAAFALF